VSVGEISSNASPYPSDAHLEVAKSIFKYLKETKDIVLKLGGQSEARELFGFSDASYVTTGNCKSRLGGVVFYGYDSGAIEKFSVNDTTVSHSSTESEIKALDLTIRAIIHCRNLLKYLLDIDLEPTTVYVDNKSAIELVKTLKSNNNTRHLAMRIEFIRECINNRIIEVVFIPTDLNVADILTKPLAAKPFLQHRERLMSGFRGRKDNIHNKVMTYSDVVNAIMENVTLTQSEYEAQCAMQWGPEEGV
jgi:hypothetical protein